MSNGQEALLMRYIPSVKQRLGLWVLHLIHKYEAGLVCVFHNGSHNVEEPQSYNAWLKTLNQETPHLQRDVCGYHKICMHIDVHEVSYKIR